MAKVVGNIITTGLSGAIGNLVFRVIRGKTYANYKMRVPDKSRETEAQRKTRTTFRKATEWAHAVLLDPEQKAYYDKRAKALKLPNAYTAAIRDYMRKVVTQQPCSAIHDAVKIEPKKATVTHPDISEVVSVVSNADTLTHVYYNAGRRTPSLFNRPESQRMLPAGESTRLLLRGNLDQPSVFVMGDNPARVIRSLPHPHPEILINQV